MSSYSFQFFLIQYPSDFNKQSVFTVTQNELDVFLFNGIFFTSGLSNFLSLFLADSSLQNPRSEERPDTGTEGDEQ